MTDKEFMKALECCSAEYIACKECPLNGKPFCERCIIENAIDLINRQQAEIERLESIISTDNQLIKSLNKCYEISKDEAIKEFAERFDDVLVGMRDEYAHFGRPEYGLVCELVHHKLLKTVKESPNYGKMSEKVLGYYSHLEHALNAYAKVAMADDDFNATSIEEVKDMLTEIKEQIHAECERIEK